MNGKKILVLFSFLLFSCATLKIKQEKPERESNHFYKEGLNFEIPVEMKDSTDDAKKFGFRNFIIEKNKHYDESNIVIAIREVENFNNLSLQQFAEIDINRVKQYYKLRFINNWIPVPLVRKGIELISFFFYYFSSNKIIYQRTVYIKFKQKFYIISLMSKEINNLENERSNFFWNSVFIYYGK